MSQHRCVHTLPTKEWRESLEGQDDEVIANWVRDVETQDRSLLKSTYYRTYYRLSRQELGKRKVRP